jgi:hypothetical protein
VFKRSSHTLAAAFQYVRFSINIFAIDSVRKKILNISCNMQRIPVIFSPRCEKWLFEVPQMNRRACTALLWGWGAGVQWSPPDPDTHMQQRLLSVGDKSARGASIYIPTVWSTVTYPRRTRSVSSASRPNYWTPPSGDSCYHRCVLKLIFIHQHFIL